MSKDNSPIDPSPPRAELDALIALFNNGRPAEVLARGERLAGRFPRSPELHELLGAANGRLGRFEQAANCFGTVLRINPLYPRGHYNLAAMLQNLGRVDEAVVCYEQAIKVEPDEAQAQYSLGVLLHGLGRLDGAVARYERTVGIKPDHAEAHYNLGSVLLLLDREDEAIACYEQALRVKPDFAQAHYNLGNILWEAGRTDEAITCYQHALTIKPDFAEVHYNLGAVVQALDHLDEAVACYERALQIKPDFAEVHFNLGNAVRDLGRLDEAVACYGQAVRIKSDYAEAHNNLGIVLDRLGRLDEAMASYERALAARPDYAEAWYNLGTTLQYLSHLDEAIACYERALAIRPDYAEARSQKLLQQATICDWDALRAEADAMAGLGVVGDVASPFAMLPFDDDPARNRIRSEKYAAREYRQSSPISLRPTERPDGIRIGYFSGDFHNHATMYLMARLLELHDRDRFSVHLFSYGPDENDGMRRRLREAADAFHYVRFMGDKKVADLARSEQIDIAVDLKGYTLANRLGMFACRAAPVQLSYLGYPGTLGAPFIDYLIADRVVIPEGQRRHYSEKLVYLPNSYQANDDSRSIIDRAMTRTEMGLPEDGFIFCCFNNTYKISPEEFDIWMRLLGQVDGSVLWLFKANRWGEENLRKEAQKRGIEADRLIFAEHMPLPEHLARHAQADLFLDTFNVNAHTTASDALWAGLPLVTRAGNGFAARVASSLLTAVGLPELITTTSDDYEHLALDLARDPQRLAQIRTRLAANRLTEPLFNSELFARQIEAAYERVYDNYLEGRDPADIAIE